MQAGVAAGTMSPSYISGPLMRFKLDLCQRIAVLAALLLC